MSIKKSFQVAIKALVALKMDYTSEEFDPDVANDADEAMQFLIETTRHAVSCQAANLIEAASHIAAAALDEDGTPEMANIAALCLAEAQKLI